MSDTPRDNEASRDMHRARPTPQRRLSPIWIVPIVAMLIGLWLVYDNYRSRGPLITLTMSSADGIEAGSTLIKTRNVEVGRVERVQLSDDMSHAVITARMSPDTDDLLTEGSRFWVVKPRIGREGISGLGTVLSGAYIQLEPGGGESGVREFQVSDQPPVAPADAAGIRVNLVSQLGNSLRTGDPVTYQGYTVGRVEEVDFDPDLRRMNQRIFIESPYDRLVTDGTRFWSASGVDLRLDADGIRVNVESIEALLGGGVTFGVPDDLPRGRPVEDGATFNLYPDEESARQGTFNRYLEYVLLVEDSVRGLSRGAPVEFRGVRIGTVASVPWEFTATQPETRGGFAIPVLIRIEPQRLGIENQEVDLEEWDQRFRRLFGRGLRASLKSGNLLTGAMFVDINFYREEADDYVAETFSERTVFPTTSTGFAQIESQVTALLEKLNALEIQPLLTGLERNLAASEAMLGEVRELSASLQGVLDDPGTRNLPANLNASLEALRETLEGMSPESSAYRELTGAAERLERTLRELQPVTRTLNENPRALLFDSLDAEDPTPRAPRTN
ncbi:intermembrane transport protein PqiB [Halomonas sp. MCCC 1A17488]|uniref:Intermembrane transport protein PqiB n=1 Tax=Billgrantia sulfidoxydans TaxID=2733484 RepID=A0ABX7W7F2_9GAMM|nr:MULTISPECIES: intermembrane transport protein PqiB [Halomonas]MCE8015300.1 intermembrane transport protein PqiB [Halomonas sp. MCCC 1A17488]MCG3238633.1 intermembrane transport protein PqiB [Halomonas sp. MCCC 1A17488]QPP51391.1 intermembrane transport protein PqiB [Halomonas sp. SS10-MC5]QTP54943.1 intermembrane transport protein PqiB [Halomonas sulfidoxydans]